MTTIVAAHYAENYAALAKEPFIRRMAQDVIDHADELPFKLVHDSTTDPTFEFMQISRAAYHRALEAGQATTTPESIGAVAHAILLVRAEILSGQAS